MHYAPPYLNIYNFLKIMNFNSFAKTCSISFRYCGKLTTVTGGDLLWEAKKTRNQNSQSIIPQDYTNLPMTSLAKTKMRLLMI